MKDREGEGEESRAAFIKNLKIERLMDKRHFYFRMWNVLCI